MVAISTVAAVAGVVSAAIGAVGAISAGNAQNAMAKRNAAAADTAAENSRGLAGQQLAVGEAEAARTEEATRRRIATASNTFSASGVDTSSGSPLDVVGDIAGEGALDAQIIRWKGRSAANASLVQSGIQTGQASIDLQAGSNAQTAGYVGAGTTLLSTASAYATNKANLAAYKGNIPPGTK